MVDRLTNQDIGIDHSSVRKSHHPPLPHPSGELHPEPVFHFTSPIPQDRTQIMTLTHRPLSRILQPPPHDLTRRSLYGDPTVYRWELLAGYRQPFPVGRGEEASEGGAAIL